jgi:hypothetical protein
MRADATVAEERLREGSHSSRGRTADLRRVELEITRCFNNLMTMGLSADG